jgi:stage II sporulation protein AA (anti-sigma F factor antagonist)
MTESLAHDDVEEPSFTVYAEEPSLLHLSGELDLNGGPELATALEPLTRRGGTITIDVADLTFMDSTGINMLCAAARDVGGRGRVVVLHSTPAVRRVFEITGLAEHFAINGEPTTPHASG